MVSSARCLVTGASGYIGGRLVPELLAAGYSVRCMARDPGKLSDRPWSAQVEITAADALDRSGVRQALDGIDVAYYLIHSLGTGSSFEQRDRDFGPERNRRQRWQHRWHAWCRSRRRRAR